MAVKEDGRLTIAQEIFVNALIKGKTQRQAYLEAYPKRAHWKPGSLDTNACCLLKQPKVKHRHEELLAHTRRIEAEKMVWTREQSIESLRYVIDINRADLDRIYQTAEDELMLLQKQIEDNPKKATQLIKSLIKQKKQRRASGVNNKGITDAVAELNKMQGYNEENINLNGAVMFEGEGQLKD